MISTKLKLATLACISCVYSTTALAVEWNVSLWGKQRAFTEHIEKLSELVDKKTNGDFKLKLHYGAALSKNKENLDGISIGAFEMAQFCAGYHRDKNPTITVLELPFLGTETLEQELKVSKAVYAHPATQKDLARWNAKLIMPTPLPQYNVAGVGKAPANLADFKGMRIRATGGIGAAFKAVGAVPTSMTASEVYNALESGVIRAASFAQHAHKSFRTIDIAKWWTTNLNPGTVNCPVVANNDAFNKLSDAHKDALLGSIDEAMAYYLTNYQALIDTNFDPLLKEKGIEKVSFTADQIEQFKKIAAEPAKTKWIADMEAKGIPGQELYDLVIKTLAEK